jgi:hypothetical protein
MYKETNERFPEKTLMYLINAELEHANLEFKPFSSIHEGYAVTLEEVQELKTETKKINSIMKDYWTLCRNHKNSNNEEINIKINILLEELEKVVVLALKELLQVGAMALKGRRG